LVKFILLPLAHKQSKSQAKMKHIEPEMKAVRDKYKNDKQEQGRQTMELYKKHGVNPFSGCLVMIVQIPVLLALYYVFFEGIKSGINADILYSFVHVPGTINTVFLGLVDLMSKSPTLAFLAAATQYYQMKLTMPAPPKTEVAAKKDGELNFQEEFAKNMSTQFRYILPIMVFVFASSFSAAIALYWTTSNVFSIIHELFVKRQIQGIIGTSKKQP
jgi:YidC/Oxa1 family membrane protein insertase